MWPWAGVLPRVNLPLCDYFLNSEHILAFKRPFLNTPDSLFCSSCSASCCSPTSPNGCSSPMSFIQMLQSNTISKLSQCLQWIPTTVEGSLCHVRCENKAEQIPDLKRLQTRRGRKGSREMKGGSQDYLNHQRLLTPQSADSQPVPFSPQLTAVLERSYLTG